MSSSRRETFRVAPAFAGVLARHGISNCDSLVETQLGIPLRRLPTRENWRLDLTDGNRTVTLYLKKHRVRTFATCLRAALGIRPPATPARIEAEWTARLADLGIPAMSLAAFAERLRPNGMLESSFLTEALDGYEQLDLFLIRHVHERRDPTLGRLIAAVADIAARFHRAGLNHRDFYSCHFFVHEHSFEAPRQVSSLSAHAASRLPLRQARVRLIDLQRLQHWPALLRRRWIVKDLAQLSYSCPPHLIGRAERMRFLKQYFGLARLDRHAKRFARAVLRREAALVRKHGPYRDWDAELSVANAA